MMRTVDWRRIAAIVLCLLGFFVSKAVCKTLREDAATEGKCALNVHSLCSLNLLVSWLMVPLACSDADGTKT